MKRSLTGAVCAIALLCGGVAVGPIVFPPAYAQSDDVSFDSFHDALAQYGDWVYSDRWGEVWMPDAGPDFQPYGTSGYWADTDEYGWTWVSEYPWGDIPFHYGRWVADPDDGWMWIPGYVWSPAWVVWRGNDQMTGWMPMPPDRRFLGGEGDVDAGGWRASINFNDPGDFYGYRDWYGPSYDESRFAAAWVFVNNDHFADRDFRRYEAPRASYNTFIHNTKNVTNYSVSNNVIVNKSVDEKAIERAGGHPVQHVQASAVMHKASLITKVDQGRQVQQRQRAAMPHGDGKANSAPKPTPQMVNGLSTKTPAHRGGGAAHVFSKQTVEKAPLRATPASATQAQEPAQQQREEREPNRNAAPKAEPKAAPKAAPAAPKAAPRPEAQRPETQRPEMQRPPAARPEARPETPRPQAAPHPEARPETPRAAPQTPPKPEFEPRHSAPRQPAPPPREEAPKAQPARPAPPPAARPEPPRPPQAAAPKPPPKAPPPKGPPPKDEHKEEPK